MDLALETIFENLKKMKLALDTKLETIETLIQIEEKKDLSDELPILYHQQEVLIKSIMDLDNSIYELETY